MLILKRVRESRFARQVAVLAGGTAFAHLLTLGTLPLITRLYTPEQFGIFGVFVALLSIVSVVGNWRYEIAIPLPSSDARAVNLAAVALFCGFLTTFLTALFVFFLGAKFSEINRFSGVVEYLWLLPVGVFFTASYAVFQYWATRKKAFSKIAKTRVEQAFGGVLTQLALGWSGLGATGLILGQIVNNGAGLLGLATRACREDRTLISVISKKEMKDVAREYDRFPKYSYIEALANMASVQLPLIFIGMVAAGAEVGFLMLGMRLMQAPVGLIGSSISQVFFNRAVEEHRKQQLTMLVVRSFATLAKIGVGPLIFAGLVSPSVFQFVFGEEWFRAGVLVRWMTPWFVFQFLTQPISMAMHVTSSQRLALALQICGFVLRFGTVFLVVAVSKESLVSEVYAVSGAIFYFVYMVLVLRVSGVRWVDIRGSFFQAAPFVFGWIVLGWFFLYLFEKCLRVF